MLITKIAPNMLHDPTTAIQIQRSLKAFINNVVLRAATAPMTTLLELQTQAKMKLCWWDKLVKVMGGELNPLKCCGLLYTWVPDKHGILQLQQLELPKEFISVTTAMVNQNIQILKNDHGTRYLGLYIKNRPLFNVLSLQSDVSS